MHNLQTISNQDKIALVIMELVADKFNKFSDKLIKFNEFNKSLKTCTASNTISFVMKQSIKLYLNSAFWC